MAGVDVGTAYLTVVPSARGFAGKLQAELGGGMEAAGRKAGDSAGKGFGSRFTSAVSTASKAGALALLSAGVGAVAFAKGAVAEARESQKVGAITEQIIKSTGGAAKVTAEQVADLAGAISAKTGVDDEAIQAGSNLLLTFKNVRNEVGKGANIFDRATQAAADLSAAGFGDMSATSKQLGKALNDPLKGITALSRAGVTFTDQQEKQIETLVKSGKTLDAQKIILAEVESQVGGTAAASATAGDKAKVAWDNLKESVGTALLPVLDRLGNWFIKDGLPAVQRFGNWLKDDLWPVLRDAWQTILPGLQEAWKILTDDVGDGEGTLKKFGAILKDYVIPAMAWLIREVLPVVATGLRVVIEAVKLSAAGFSSMAETAAGALAWVLRKVGDLAAGFAVMLRGLAKVPGFGWAADAAKKMEAAAGKARDMARAIDNIKTDIKVNVDIHARTRQTGRIDLPKGASVNVGMREHGGPVRAGQPYIVGEKRPELFVPDRNGTILPKVPNGGGGGVSVQQHFHGITSAEEAAAASVNRLTWAMRTA